MEKFLWGGGSDDLVATSPNRSDKSHFRETTGKSVFRHLSAEISHNSPLGWIIGPNSSVNPGLRVAGFHRLAGWISRESRVRGRSGASLDLHAAKCFDAVWHEGSLTRSTTVLDDLRQDGSLGRVGRGVVVERR